MFAVQIAKWFGAEVTGVCSTTKMDMVRSIGADHVIDYGKEDFTRSGKQYDLILDTGGNRSLSQLRRALGADGNACNRRRGRRRSLDRRRNVAFSASACVVAVR